MNNKIIIRFCMYTFGIFGIFGTFGIAGAGAGAVADVVICKSSVLKDRAAQLLFQLYCMRNI